MGILQLVNCCFIYDGNNYTHSLLLVLARLLRLSAVHQRSRSQPEMLSTYSLEQAQVQGHNETEQQEESSSSTSFSSLDEDDIDMLPDADREKDVFRAKVSGVGVCLYVCYKRNTQSVNGEDVQNE